MFFKKKKPRGQVINTYSEACKLMKKMGVNIRPSVSGKSSIVTKNGLSWTFSGDEDGFAIGRKIHAPTNWNEDALVEWMYQKNFVVAIYDQQNKQFVIATHVLLKGGVVVQNLARLVHNFDATIRSFLVTMKIDESQLIDMEKSTDE